MPAAGTTVILKALQFAARKHERQRRKDVAASPYINHPIAVANLLAEVGEVTDIDVLVAAILHDTWYAVLQAVVSGDFDRVTAHPEHADAFLFECVCQPHPSVLICLASRAAGRKSDDEKV